MCKRGFEDDKAAAVLLLPVSVCSFLLSLFFPYLFFLFDKSFFPRMFAHHFPASCLILVALPCLSRTFLLSAPSFFLLSVFFVCFQPRRDGRVAIPHIPSAPMSSPVPCGISGLLQAGVYATTFVSVQHQLLSMCYKYRVNIVSDQLKCVVITHESKNNLSQI